MEIAVIVDFNAKCNFSYTREGDKTIGAFLRMAFAKSLTHSCTYYLVIPPWKHQKALVFPLFLKGIEKASDMIWVKEPTNSQFRKSSLCIDLIFTSLLNLTADSGIHSSCHCTKNEFSIKDSLRKFDQIRSFQPIWSHLLKKSLMHNFIFCAVFHLNCHHQMILAKTYSFTQKNVWHQNLTNNGIIRNSSEGFDSKKNLLQLLRFFRKSSIWLK